MKQKYNLAAVLKLRERTREAAADDARRRQEALREEQAKLEQCLVRVLECRRQQQIARDRTVNAANQAVAVKKLTDNHFYLIELRRLEQQLIAASNQQKSAVNQARQAVDHALAALVEATKEVRVIEKHRENWLQQLKLDENRREQKMLDEIATSYRF